MAFKEPNRGTLCDIIECQLLNDLIKGFDVAATG